MSIRGEMIITTTRYLVWAQLALVGNTFQRLMEVVQVRLCLEVELMEERQ